MDVQRTRAPLKIPIRMSIHSHLYWVQMIRTTEQKNSQEDTKYYIYVTYLYGSLISHTEKSSCENRVKFLWENKISWVCENFILLFVEQQHA